MCPTCRGFLQVPIKRRGRARIFERCPECLGTNEPTGFLAALRECLSELDRELIELLLEAVVLEVFRPDELEDEQRAAVPAAANTNAAAAQRTTPFPYRPGVDELRDNLRAILTDFNPEQPHRPLAS